MMRGKSVMPGRGERCTSVLSRGMVLCLLASCGLLAGDTIVPDFGGAEPKFPPASYGIMRSENSPSVYRAVFDATPETLCVALRVKTKGPMAVRVNGVLLCERSPDPKFATPRADLYWARASGDATDVVISHRIRPGKNVLAISASPDGLTAEGAVVQRGGEMRRFATASSWRAKKYPPCSFLRSEKALQSPDDPCEGWFAVKASADRGVAASDDEIRGFVEPALEERRAGQMKDLAWRAGLIMTRGTVLDDWEACGFGDAGRLADDVLALARALQTKILAGKPDQGMYELMDGMTALSLAIRLSDEAECLANTASAIKVKDAKGARIAEDSAAEFRDLAAKALAALRDGKYTDARRSIEGAAWGRKIDAAYRAVESSWGNVANRLNQSDANRFGWFDVTHLLDNDVNGWGLRVGDVALSWKMDLNGTWRFKLDPKNTGLKETYHDPAYNIEGQWPEITAPGDWEHQGVHDLNPGIKETNPFPGVNDQLQDCPYNGWAWYRKTLQVPQEWAGYDLELFVGRVDDYDWTYFNGKEIGHTAYDTNPKDFWQAERKYRIPKEAVKFGGINVIAIRVFDCRDKGGIMGDVELRCPGLRQAFENRPADAAKVKPAVAWSSPLSIATILTAGQDPLKLWGWNERGIRGPQAIVLPLKDGVKLKALAKTGVAYDPKAEGELAENWALLWPDEGSADKPVLAVFLDRPRQIAATVGPEKGTSRIEIAYGKEAARIVLARPFRDPMKFGDRVPADVVELCRFWGKALLAYPVAFTEVNEQRADDPWSLDVTDVYTYRFLKDAWGTEPLKVAPLPPFAIYAAEKKFSGVALPESAKDLGYNMGKFGRLKGAAGADRISYRVPLDRIPAFGGTTSFAFSPIDIGPGNALEVKAVSLFGGNGWRPQTVKPPCPELQHCLKAGQELGVNVLHNSSSDYAGGNDKVPGLYERLAEAYKDLPFEAVSYDPFNEPAGLKAAEYNPLVKKTIEAIRKHDKRHLIYVESPESFASALMLAQIEPLDDPLVVYSFHDYDYRLYEYWPNDRMSIRSVLHGFSAAFEFMVERQGRLHIGEWGGYEQRKEPWVWSRPHTIAQTMDMCRIFQHFNLHFHYYACRGTTRIAADGATDQSFVQEGFARFFGREHWNFYHRKNAEKGR